MAWCVDQVQLESLVLDFRLHRHRASLDRDASLAFQFHVVQQLILHLTLLHGSGMFQQPVGQRAFAVVDVGDDAKIPNLVQVYHAAACLVASDLIHSC